jgi:KipI family sensor histidine kinase inhibitor
VRYRRCGDHGILIDVDGPVLPLLAAVREAAVPGVQDLVPGDRTLLVVARSTADLDRVLPMVLAIEPSTATTAPTAELVVPVTYDGPDLQVVASAWNVEVDVVVRRHVEASWTVAFTGFSPGFGYLRTASDWPPVARRDTPRTRVPTGSVALAGTYAGVYPRDSPGGWQLIGRTSLDLFDVDREPPALLWPGRSVRFREVPGCAVRARSARSSPCSIRGCSRRCRTPDVPDTPISVLHPRERWTGRLPGWRICL